MLWHINIKIVLFALRDSLIRAYVTMHAHERSSHSGDECEKLPKKTKKEQKRVCVGP